MQKVFAWHYNAKWSHAGHVLGQQQCNTLAHSAHARAWLVHGACNFYRCERSCSISLRQLPPRLVQVLLVFKYSMLFPRYPVILITFPRYIMMALMFDFQGEIHRVAQPRTSPPISRAPMATERNFSFACGENIAGSRHEYLKKRKHKSYKDIP